ncbi:hypothetical protein [Algivirga pacifica]|uniref:Carboxypeptidase-like regulatory domain-containing protein n=1 Tax=Algivirga pacifica TaxID=1162670 RepID=A0ABP9D2U4_9BACT
MKNPITLIFLLFFFNPTLYGQTRSITGRVISEYLESLTGVIIENSDLVVLGMTDIDGRFNISIPQETDSLFFRFPGMEWADIRLHQECHTVDVEVIVMYDVTYDFMSSRKIDRLRKKRFNNLPNLHSNAVKEGLFKSNTLCYERSFNPYKPELDRIEEYLKALRKQNLMQFKNLKIGDIVKIPFGFDSPGKRVNTFYSICGHCTENDYEYVIEGEIVNKYRKHLTLEVKVLKMLPHDSIEYSEKTLKIDSTFKYQMKYFEVILN